MGSPRLLELGSRSSVDESSRPPTPGGEEEVVEPEQGNGEFWSGFCRRDVLILGIRHPSDEIVTGANVLFPRCL